MIDYRQMIRMSLALLSSLLLLALPACSDEEGGGEVLPVEEQYAKLVISLGSLDNATPVYTKTVDDVTDPDKDDEEYERYIKDWWIVVMHDEKVEQVLSNEKGDQAVVIGGDQNEHQVSVELLNCLSKKEKVSQEYWSIFTNPDLSPAGSPNECYLLKNYKRFCKSLGKEVVAKEVERRYADSLLNVFSHLSLDEAQLRLLGEEIYSFDLPRNEELQAYIQMAQASLDGVDKLVLVCEQTFPKIQTLEFPYIQFFDRVMAEGTDDEKKRWLVIGEKYVEQMEDGGMKEFIKVCVDHFNKVLFGKTN